MTNREKILQLLIHRDDTVIADIKCPDDLYDDCNKSVVWSEDYINKWLDEENEKDINK